MDDIGEIVDNVIASISESLDIVYPLDSESFWNSTRDFVEAVDWFEPWLLCLLAFHIVSFVLIILTRHLFEFQCGLFCLLAAMAFSTTFINEWAAMNWQQFATQQYFDANGFFIVAVFTGPLLINMLCLVVLWLFTAAQLLVKLKRLELRQRLAKQKEEEKAFQTPKKAKEPGEAAENKKER